MTTDANDPAGKDMSLAEAAQLRFLDAGNVRLARAGARLDLTVAGDRTYERVSVRRAFPLSCPGEYLSVRDSGNREIGVLRGMATLDAASRRLLDEELARRYLVPVVRRIVGVTERFGTVDWDVKTDRGACRFTTRDLRENVTRISENQILLTDVEDNRFEIPDVTALDPASQAWLARYL